MRFLSVFWANIPFNCVHCIHRLLWAPWGSIFQVHSYPVGSISFEIFMSISKKLNWGPFLRIRKSKWCKCIVTISQIHPSWVLKESLDLIETCNTDEACVYGRQCPVWLLPQSWWAVYIPLFMTSSPGESLQSLIEGLSLLFPNPFQEEE